MVGSVGSPATATLRPPRCGPIQRQVNDSRGVFVIMTFPSLLDQAKGGPRYHPPAASSMDIPSIIWADSILVAIAALPWSTCMTGSSPVSSIDAAAPRRISPTDVSQFVRLDQCQRFLRLGLTER